MLPPWCSMTARAMPTRLRDFIRKNPVERICGSSSSGSALASAAAFGYRAKSAGVTTLTRASVDCAERIVATSSSNASRKLSSVNALGCCVSRRSSTDCALAGVTSRRAAAGLARTRRAGAFAGRFVRVEDRRAAMRVV